MGIFEIISAIVLIIACVFIVVVILVKDTKTQMSQTISGSSSDSFYQRNAGRTKEAMLNKATIAAAVIFFVLAVAVNVINVYGKKESAGGTTSAVTESEPDHDDEESETADTSDTSAATSDTSAATSDTSAATSDTSAATSDMANSEAASE